MSKLKHHNLVQLFGIILEPIQLVMEFCPGGSLWDLLHEQVDIELRWTQQLKMATDTASAVDYLHSFSPQIIHGDLKSSNLLLGHRITGPEDAVTVKVCDFGFAGMKNESRQMTLTYWMAPEVPSGRYTEKADVYSFAMILFEIICREIPFEDDNAKDAMQAHMLGDFYNPDIEAIPPDAPQALADLMVACWAQNPCGRPGFKAICERLRNLEQVTQVLQLFAVRDAATINVQCVDINGVELAKFTLEADAKFSTLLDLIGGHVPTWGKWTILSQHGDILDSRQANADVSALLVGEGPDRRVQRAATNRASALPRGLRREVV